MSNNKSWLESGSTYFSEGRTWKIVGAVVMAAVTFMVLWTYLSRAHERGYVINQSDVVQHKGMSKEILDFRKAHDDQEPLWTSAMFGGMPTYQVSTWYPNNLMQKLDNVLNLRGIVAPPIGNLFLLFVTMFILLYSLKVDPFSAGVGAFGFMMCSYYFTVLEAGHNSKVNAVAYLPLVLTGVLMLYRGRFWLGSAITILAMGLELNANHYQITYYGLFVVAAIVLSELSRNVNTIGKGITWSLFLAILVSWAAGVPKIVWVGLAAIDFLVPITMKMLALLKEGNTFKGLLTGKGLTENGVGMRNFFVGTLLMVLCMGISIAPNVGRIMTNNEYVKVTMRGGPVHSREVDPNQPMSAQAVSGGGLDKEYAYVWSYGKAESFTIINPFYSGDAARAKVGEDSETYDILTSAYGKQAADFLAGIWPTYHGDQPMHGGPTYMGVVICFLFILGLLIVPVKYRWWILGGTVISILLSWGRNFQWFSDLFFDNLPMYNNFRAVSMWLTITSVCMAIMAGLALGTLFRNREGKTPKQQLMSVGIAAGITLFILLVLAFVQPGLTLELEQDPSAIVGTLRYARIDNPDPAVVQRLVEALPADRVGMITGQAYKGMLIVLLAAGVLGAYVWMRKSLNSKEMRPIGIAGACLILFGLIYWDMKPVDERYLNEDSFVKGNQIMQYFTPTPVDQQIKQDPDPNYRVFNMVGNAWNDAMTSYHHKSIGGYSAAKMQRYQDLIDFRYDIERNAIIDALNTQDSTQMLKVQEALSKATALNMLNCKYILLDPRGQRPPLVNGKAMGHAWIVGGYEVVEGPDQSMDKLEGLDLRAKMVLEKADADQLNGFQASPDAAATIQLTHWQSNEIKYKFSSNSGKEQLVAFSEVYYNSGKGWKAYIDGQPAEHFRCNYILRGMKVPSGNHEIVFRMEPQSYILGEKLALVFSLALFAIAAFAVFMDYRKGFKESDPESPLS